MSKYRPEYGEVEEVIHSSCFRENAYPLNNFNDVIYLSLERYIAMCVSVSTSEQLAYACDAKASRAEFKKPCSSRAYTDLD